MEDKRKGREGKGTTRRNKKSRDPVEAMRKGRQGKGVRLEDGGTVGK